MVVTPVVFVKIGVDLYIKCMGAGCVRTAGEKSISPFSSNDSLGLLTCTPSLACRVFLIKKKQFLQIDGQIGQPTYIPTYIPKANPFLYPLAYCLPR
jgi:hypothetical protein